MSDKPLTERYTELYAAILKEHREVFEAQNLENLQEFIDLLAAHDHIFVMGVGREGIAARSFAMRLMHLGKEVHWIWDDTTPGMHQGDLFLAVNGSANISHINCVLENAVKTGADTVVVTGSPSGRATSIARHFLFVPAAVFNGTDKVVPSMQPMGNLFEQHLFMLFDLIIMVLEEKLSVTHESMEKRHRNIE